MTYEVKYSNFAKKFLKNCEKDLRKRILERIDNLSRNPFPQELKRIKGTNYFRIRIDKIRIM